MKQFYKVFFLISFCFLSMTVHGQITLPVYWTGGSGGGNTDVCGPNVITYTADPIPAGLTYKWYTYNYDSTCGFNYYPQSVLLSSGSPVLVYGMTGIVQCFAVDSLGQIQQQSFDIPMFNSDLNEGICSPNEVGGTVNICIGDSALLRISDYAWNGSMSVNPGSVQWQRNGIDLQGANDLRYYATTNGTYRVKFTLSCGVGYSNQIIVNSNPAPIPPITGQTSICNGANTTFCAGAGYSCYIWNNGANTQCINVNWAGTYTVIVCDVNGCTGSASINLTVNPLPSPTINGNNTFCQGQSTTLDAGGGYSSYLWSTGQVTQTISINTPGPYTVTVTNANGCTGSTTTVVTVYPVPQAILNPGYAICQGLTENLVISFNGSPPFSYSYTDGITTFGPYTTASNPVTFSVSPSVNTTYSLLNFYDANCAGTVSGSANITVNQNPVPTISGDSTLCPGQSTVLIAGGGMTYFWNTGSTTPVISVNTLGTYTVTVSDANGCTGTDSFTITAATPYPTILSASGPLGICQGDSVELTAQSPMSSYQWHKNNSPISGATGSTFWASTTGRYKCLSTDLSNCPATSNQVRVAVVCFPPLPPSDKVMSIAPDAIIFPNPSSTDMVIQFNQIIEQPITIRVYNVSGKLVFEETNAFVSDQYVLPKQSPGYYLVELKIGEGRIKKSLIAL